jgi:hypothetical protein
MMHNKRHETRILLSMLQTFLQRCRNQRVSGNEADKEHSVEKTSQRIDFQSLRATPASLYIRESLDGRLNQRLGQS